MNPASMMKLLNVKNKFESNHPKFVAFINAVFLHGGLPEGTVIEMRVIRPGEEPIEANMKVLASDLELVEELKNLAM